MPAADGIKIGHKPSIYCMNLRRKEKVMIRWIEGIKAIRYIEDNLTEELKIENIAAKAYVSAYFRGSSMYCAALVGEYIRYRRLSLAAEELSRVTQGWWMLL